MNEIKGTQQKQDIMEKAMSRMMGGPAPAGGGAVEVVTRQEYGRTPYSSEAEKMYEATRGSRAALDASEFYAVTQGYLREWVCMAQCNLYIQVLHNPMLRQSMVTYRNDVCSPNLTEMKQLLEAGGYALPAPYNGESDALNDEQLGKLQSDVINDRMILVGHVFAVEAFMNRWNQGAALSHRADVRNAFIRNYHRTNRWAFGGDRDGAQDAVHRTCAPDSTLNVGRGARFSRVFQSHKRVRTPCRT